MFYLLYQYYEGYVREYQALNLLKYETVRMGMALLTALLVSMSMGSRFINWMRSKQGKGQPIRSDGPESHLLTKKGTPTMGGFMILAALTVSTYKGGKKSKLAVLH